MEKKARDIKPGTATAIFNSVFDTVKVIVISLAIVIPVRHYLIQPFLVKGASMEPSFYDGEYLIVDELSYRLRPPERGEVIVFHYPRNPKDYFIKRIIGLPSEKIEIKDRRVFIYNSEYPKGKELKEDYLKYANITSGSLTLQLKPNEYFVLGDNRQASSDSRLWGPVKEEHIVGRAWVRAWPVDQATVFSR